MEFRDHAVIYVRAGKGGNGCIAFRKEKYVAKGGPDGGNGGHGGSVHLIASEHENTLLGLLRNPHVRADHGEDGRGKGMHGHKGEDVWIKVPVGTLVMEKKSDSLLRDLKEDGDSVCVVKGGRGGWGNARFASPMNQAPRKANTGTLGEERDLRLELKLIADVGLVGLPNAGKSTLIGTVSAARPKVANYPFTTLQPHPGIVELSDFRRFVMVDIPGLIAGASEGHGLGHRFLRHVERTRVLIHMVELSYLDGHDPRHDYETICKELERYSAALAKKPRITVFSKADMVPDPDERARELAAELGIEAYAVSSATRFNLDRVLEDAWKLLHPNDEA